MINDLKIIKDKYGERMMHLCRELFSTILEEKGMLSNLLLANFNPTRSLYDDLIKYNKVEDFKNYIYSFAFEEEKEIKEVSKTPFELLEEAGYKLYECKSEEEIQSFKKYYTKAEELCTFRDSRLKKCHVFFAVKINAENIKRKDKPEREDEYGTSVISIQFTRGRRNALSIKNRYNHTVTNPDATFSNNLNNIIEGLTESFEYFYNFNICNKLDSDFDLPYYVKADDGKYYKYNYEIRNIYYCPDNIIIDNFKVKHFDKEKYIVLDYFILDLVNKEIYLYDKTKRDSFTHGICDIEKIEILKNKDDLTKKINIICKDNDVLIEIDSLNRIIVYENLNLKEVKDFYLSANKSLKKINLPNLEKVGDCFLISNISLEELSLPKLRYVGDYFIGDNKLIKELDLPNLEYVGTRFLFHNESLKKVYLPKLIKAGEKFMPYNVNLTFLNLPNLVDSKELIFYYNNSIVEINLPKLPLEQKQKLIILVNKINNARIEIERFNKNLEKTKKI